MKPKLQACLDLLKANKQDEFMKIVWPVWKEVLVPKPWDHVRSSERKASGEIWCVQCRKTWPCRASWLAREKDCSGPPLLTESPEVLAFRLRDKVVEKDHGDCLLDKARADIHEARTGEPYDWGRATRWYADRATPHEQILCCLVVLGLIET